MWQSKSCVLHLVVYYLQNPVVACRAPPVDSLPHCLIVCRRNFSHGALPTQPSQVFKNTFSGPWCAGVCVSRGLLPSKYKCLKRCALANLPNLSCFLAPSPYLCVNWLTCFMPCGTPCCREIRSVGGRHAPLCRLRCVPWIAHQSLSLTGQRVTE